MTDARLIAKPHRGSFRELDGCLPTGGASRLRKPNATHITEDVSYFYFIYTFFFCLTGEICSLNDRYKSYSFALEIAKIYFIK